MEAWSEAYVSIAALVNTKLTIGNVSNVITLQIERTLGMFGLKRRHGAWYVRQRMIWLVAKLIAQHINSEIATKEASLIRMSLQY